MLKIILISVISFGIGFLCRGIKKKKKYKKVQALNKQNFKKAMKDLEIK